MLQVLLPGILGSIGSIISGIFQLKQTQGQIVAGVVNTAGTVAAGASSELESIASIVRAEASSQSWLAASWRPILMLLFGGLIVSFWFGYSPPHINDPLSPIMTELFGLMKLGIGGYIGGRTVEKVMAGMNVAKIASQYINKKVL